MANSSTKVEKKKSRRLSRREVLDHLSIYEKLHRFNEHMEQAVALLGSLSAQLAAERANISYYRLAIGEARTGATQGILESMNGIEIAENARLSRARLKREKSP